MLSALVERETLESIDLSNGITIEVSTASFRSIRGYALVAALGDQVAFWSDEGANPDSEILAAIRPGMATIPGAMLLCASSPYARRGALYEAHRKHHGKNGDRVLVWQAATRVMNPSVPQSVIDDAIEADPAGAAAEFQAQFRADVETFIAREVIIACTLIGRFELPPTENERYVAFVDPSGGSSDAMTLAIAHQDQRGIAVLDAVREVRPPFSPEAVVSDFADLLRTYGVTTVRGDCYGGLWPRERFRVHEITYETSKETRSEIYSALLPMLNSRQVDFLDLPRLQSQLIGLERRTARGGRDTIDHAPGGHDDVANAVAGALVMATARRAYGRPPPVSVATAFSRSSNAYESTQYGWLGRSEGGPWRFPGNR